MNKKELKKISYDFRVVAKRLLKVDFDEFGIVLSKFMHFIESNELIYNYVTKCLNPLDVQKEMEEIEKYYGRAFFDLGNTTEQEVSNIYQILKYILDNNINARKFASGYTTSNKFQDMVDEFNNRVTLVLIQHIESYLTKIGIEMGLDDNTNYSILVKDNGGNVQFNLATENSIVNAVQNVSIDYDKLIVLIKNVEKNINDKVEIDIKEAIQDNIECLKELVEEKKPRKNVLKLCANSIAKIIPKVKEWLELSAALTQLVQFIQDFNK